MKPTVTAIMQARMGSSRLPGKILLEAGGQTFLEHSFSRLLLSKLTDQAVIATTVEDQDRQVADFCQRKNWNWNRGSEHDVLDRYYQTALAYPADIIVRVTSDCPLLDPAVIDKVIQCLIDDFPNTHYASNVLPTRTFPRGLDVEAFTFAALKEAWESAGEGPEREHVTTYLHSNPGIFKTASVTADQTDDCSAHRWTLDTPEDQTLLTHILDLAPQPTSWHSVLNLVQEHPVWNQVNRHIEQKKI